MMNENKLKIIGHRLCPFVQRIMIMMRCKDLDHDIEYVEDLSNLPDWLIEISPLGRVPVLQVGDSVLFESHVIMNYLNNIGHGDMRPSDLLVRARQYSLMELASDMLMSQFVLMAAKTKEELESRRAGLLKNIDYLEKQLHASPFFNGDQLSMIDVSVAPLIQRLLLSDQHYGLDLLKQSPKLKQWGDALLARPELIASGAGNLAEGLLAGVREQGGLLAAA